jgi:hypothetical protein
MATKCRDIKEIKTKKFEGFGPTRRSIKSFPCMATPDYTQVCLQGKQMQKWDSLFCLILSTVPI